MMNMHKILITLCICLGLYASPQYDLKYKLQSLDEQIGIFHVKCDKNKNVYTYTNKFNINFEYLFKTHKYAYSEVAKVKDGKLLSVLAHKNEDGKMKKIRAEVKNNILVYEDGKSIDLSLVDYLPFDIRESSILPSSQQKKFKRRTFDTLSAKRIFETYTLLPSIGRGSSYEIKNNEETELKTYDKNGILIYLKNSLFEMTLLEK